MGEIDELVLVGGLLFCQMTRVATCQRYELPSLASQALQCGVQEIVLFVNAEQGQSRIPYRDQEGNGERCPIHMDIERTIGEGIFFVGVLNGQEGRDKEGSDGYHKMTNEEDDRMITGAFLEMLKNAKIAGLNDLLLSIGQI
jgi:hypothetical protein